MKYTIVICIAGGLFMTGCAEHRHNFAVTGGKDLGSGTRPAGATGAPLRVSFSNLDYFEVPVVRSESGYKVLSVERAGASGSRDAFSAFASFRSSVGEQTCLGKHAAVGYAAREVAKTADRRCKGRPPPRE